MGGPPEHEPKSSVSPYRAYKEGPDEKVLWQFCSRGHLCRGKNSTYKESQWVAALPINFNAAATACVLSSHRHTTPFHLIKLYWYPTLLIVLLLY